MRYHDPKKPSDLPTPKSLWTRTIHKESSINKAISDIRRKNRKEHQKQNPQALRLKECE